MKEYESETKQFFYSTVLQQKQLFTVAVQVSAGFSYHKIWKSFRTIVIKRSFNCCSRAGVAKIPQLQLRTMYQNKKFTHNLLHYQTVH